MEGWSSLSNGSSLDCIGVERVFAFHDNDCFLVKDHVDNAADNDKVKQKCSFYQNFPDYLKDSCSKGFARSVPVGLGNGQLVDLYKLFSLVKERGGYAVVSEKGLWGNVTKQLGLDLELLALVKLVYDKYLNDFERQFRNTFEEKNIKNGNHGCDWDFESLPLDLEKEFRGLLRPNLKDKDDDELVMLESEKIRKYIDLVSCNNDTNILDTKNQNNKCKDVQQVDGDDDDEKSCNGIKDDPASLGAESTKKEFTKNKRKREALTAMLNWMRHIAKHPLDPLTQPMPKPLKWKEYEGQNFFGQVLRAREVLLQSRHVERNSGSSSLQKVKMHPAMYDDPVTLDHRATVRLRCSERLPTSVKSRSCSCCNPCSPNGNRLASSINTEAENCPLEKKTTPDLLTAKIMADPSGDDVREKQVSVGPLFQAEVPEWTGVVSESDSKWLGTQVWPLKHDTKPATETDLLGRGKQSKCCCQFRGSVKCVRFHIIENRLKLKLKLGSVFYHWGFDQMGEEVSLQWTAEEEKKFKDIMRSNIPSQKKLFWNNPSKYFPNKTRRDLVSYYFNVFLIQLRSYQNRVTPKNVDSDDDEVEFGSFSDGFGVEAVKVSSIDLLECSENKQCTDSE
ncbi:AT-rich interactive domain-containing protein 2 [Abrus precatorius]|uniref:AT-rich interactive domain-containing protein 2 n=1 Tax=Abrus precatorius TaxID=3816 RepID=A0A8B8KFP2_ABRPR|nr:AT-rich interactive domain-containing protein 2 [Abrus precatorius]